MASCPSLVLLTQPFSSRPSLPRQQGACSRSCCRLPFLAPESVPPRPWRVAVHAGGAPSLSARTGRGRAPGREARGSCEPAAVCAVSAARRAGDLPGTCRERPLLLGRRCRLVWAPGRSPDAGASCVQVREALRHAPGKYEDFLQVIYEFESSAQRQTAVDLYRSLQLLLQDWPQLLKDFAAFLLPEQALACGLVSAAVAGAGDVGLGRVHGHCSRSHGPALAHRALLFSRGDLPGSSSPFPSRGPRGAVPLLVLTGLREAPCLVPLLS